jgi:hypothetical protein
MWCNVCALTKLHPFKKPALHSLIYTAHQEWHDLFVLSDNPNEVEIPGGYELSESYEHIEDIEAKEVNESTRTRQIYKQILRLCVLKCLRPDCLSMGYE